MSATEGALSATEGALDVNVSAGMPELAELEREGGPECSRSDPLEELNTRPGMPRGFPAGWQGAFMALAG